MLFDNAEIPFEDAICSIFVRNRFSCDAFKYSEYLNTMAKLTPVKESGRFWYVLFSESGFDEAILDEAKKSEHVRLYSMEEVVNFKP